MTSRARLCLTLYVVAVGAVAFLGINTADTNVEAMGWGVGRWIIGAAAASTLPAGLAVLPASLYVLDTTGLTSGSEQVEFLTVALAFMLAAAANGLLVFGASRRLTARRRGR